MYNGGFKMTKLILIGQFLIENWQYIVAGLIGMLSGYVAIMKLIPGEQGETFIAKIVKLLKKLPEKKE